MKKLPTHVLRAPYCQPFRRGSSNWPQIDQLKNFLPIFNTESKFKGGLFYTKKCQLLSLGTHIVGRFGKMRVSANRPRMDQIENFSKPFSTKSKLKGDRFHEKNCQLVYLGSLNAGHFKQIGDVCQSTKKRTNFDFCNNFLYRIKIQRGIYFMEKIDISCSQGPMGRAVLVMPMPADRSKLDHQYYFV